jgi:8-oxo-dGTP pyrophosphatase MutT (NUDIX family)
MQILPEYMLQKLQEAQASGDESDGYAEIPVTPHTRLKCAAVLLPLTYTQGQWHILFTRRTDRVPSHKGQVSFPGGACDEGETTPEETALREADEEIGLRRGDVKILGRLNPLITISHYRVTPVVGIIPFPYAFKVAGAEVARVFTIPLLWLSDPNHYWEFVQRGAERSVIAYHPFDGELLWGATARMTLEFLKTIEALGCQDFD